MTLVCVTDNLLLFVLTEFVIWEMNTSCLVMAVGLSVCRKPSCNKFALLNNENVLNKHLVIILLDLQYKSEEPIEGNPDDERACKD